jgi:hypothetical protein
MTTEAKKDFDEKRGQLALWLGFLLPPTAWALQLQIVYLLSEYGCGTGNFLPNHIASAIALVLSAFGGLFSWHNWMKAGGEWKSEEAGTIARSRFLAILGVLTGALFTIVIFAQWLPTIVGVPCENVKNNYNRQRAIVDAADANENSNEPNVDLQAPAAAVGADPAAFDCRRICSRRKTA